MDSLPPDIIAAITGALVSSLDEAELRRAFRVVTEALLVEVGQVDTALLNRLAGPLATLAENRRHLTLTLVRRRRPSSGRDGSDHVTDIPAQTGANRCGERAAEMLEQCRWVRAGLLPKGIGRPATSAAHGRSMRWPG